MKKKPCRETDCDRPKFQNFQRCYWHKIASEPPDRQAESSAARLRAHQAKPDFIYRARVPASEWPPGERWCAGCQGFVPAFYVTGSRCKGCASKAAHAGHVERTFGITSEEYEALRELQGGRCYICGRRPRSRRLAVDHDHRHCKEGCRLCVRGLLCADSDRGCNHAVVGVIEASSTDGGLAAARRLVDYLERPPFARLREQAEGPPTAEAAEGPVDVFAELFG